MNWKEFESVLYVDLPKTQKIAAFDLDGTLIVPKSGKRFPVDNNDWKLYCPNTKSKLKQMIENGYSIVIITNQSTLKGKNGWKEKIEAIRSLLEIDFSIYVSTEKDRFRKPSPFIWNKFIKTYDENSFYCGDAAGRLTPKKDFADTDLKMAINLNLMFYTPEDFFLGKKQEYERVLKHPLDTSKTKYNQMYVVDEKEMIINVGYPGSGKSRFTKTKLSEYEHINQDTSKTAVKTLKAAEEALKNSKSVVIDNINPDKKSRQKYIELAVKYGYPIRCFHFTTSMEISYHNMLWRNIDKNVSRIPMVAYYTFRKKFEEPSVEEGFSGIEKIDFAIEDGLNKNYFKFYS